MLVRTLPTQTSGTSLRPGNEAFHPFDLPTLCWCAPCRLKEVRHQAYLQELYRFSSCLLELPTRCWRAPSQLHEWDINLTFRRSTMLPFYPLELPTLCWYSFLSTQTNRTLTLHSGTDHIFLFIRLRYHQGADESLVDNTSERSTLPSRTRHLPFLFAWVTNIVLVCTLPAQRGGMPTLLLATR